MRTDAAKDTVLRYQSVSAKDCGFDSVQSYCEAMRTAIAVLGVIVALFGLLFTLQGFGIVVSDSPMTNNTTWVILGPIIALVGVALAVGSLRRRP